MVRGRLLLGGIAVAAGLVAFACDDPPVPQPCSDIPVHGCPLANGIACEDHRCAAVYLCRQGNIWELQQTCPSYDPDAGEATFDAGTDADAGPVPDPAPNAPPGAYGGPGCAVLEEPDCSVGLALACGAGCCNCGDLFVCRDGAWDLWGACDAKGVHQTP